jgi:hypothetical protein
MNSEEYSTKNLRHGTIDEHLGTLKRAKEAGLSYVWSGDIRRNPYLAENLRFGEEFGILTTEWVESDQESGWLVFWTDKPKDAEKEKSRQPKQLDADIGESKFPEEE